MDIQSNIYDPSGYTPLFQIIFAFVLGILFSPYSKGILFLVIFILLFELWYSYYNNFDYYGINGSLRPALILYSIFGFLVGRTFVCLDFNPIRGDYNDDDEVKNHFNEYNEELKDCYNDTWK